MNKEVDSGKVKLKSVPMVGLPDKDSPTSPGHYKNGSIQPIEYILANDLGFCEGNVVKYITRWQYADGVTDLKKAKQYIQFLIDKWDDNDG